MVIKEIEREEIEFICKVCCHFMPYALILTCSCWPWVYGVCSVRLCLVRQLVCVLRMMLLHPHRSHGHRTTGIIVLALWTPLPLVSLQTPLQPFSLCTCPLCNLYFGTYSLCYIFKFKINWNSGVHCIMYFRWNARCSYSFSMCSLLYVVQIQASVTFSVWLKKKCIHLIPEPPMRAAMTTNSVFHIRSMPFPHKHVILMLDGT